MDKSTKVVGGIAVVATICVFAGVIVTAVWYKAPSVNENPNTQQATMVLMGLRVGVEIACGLGEVPDRDLALGYAGRFNDPLRKELFDAFTVGVGVGFSKGECHQELLAKTDVAQHYLLTK
jgi:hypothetical protein